MRYTFLFLALLLLLPGALAAQSAEVASVSGRVTDATTGAPLEKAVVTISRAGVRIASVATDARGRFTLARLPLDSVSLRVAHAGYAAWMRDLRIRERGAEELAVALQPTAVALAPLEIIGRSPAAQQTLTGTATVIGARQVEQIAPVGTQELLQYVPGVSAFADDGIGNSRTNVGFRGLNPRRSSRVLVLEDGIPIQPALYIYPNLYYSPPVERIDRVEVIKGSAGIRYGPHTMGGVVNYITRRPRESFGGRSQLVAGTDGFLSLFTEVGGGAGQAIQPEAQLLFKRGDGFRENNGFEQYNGTLKLNLFPGADRSLYLKANVNRENINATYTGLTEYSFRTDPDFNPKRFDDFQIFRTALDLLYNRPVARNLTADTRAYLSYFDRRWWREDDVFVRAGQFGTGTIDPVPPFQTGDLIRVGGGATSHGYLRSFYVAGVEQAYALEHALFGRPAALTFGARGHWERFIDDRQLGLTPDAREGVYYLGDPADPASLEIVGQSQHYETTALALFATERVEVGRLTATPGLRVEVFEQERIDRLRGSRYEDRTSWVVLPGIGLNYALGAVHLFGGVHRGYTPPSSGTLQVVNFGADVENGGLDLRPEQSWNFEAGARGTLPWLAFEAAAFRVDIEDMVAAGRGTVFRNLGRVSTAGVELGATVPGVAFARFLPDLNVAYTYLDTEVEEGIIRSAVIPGGVEVSIAGLELPYAPRHTLVAGVSTRRADGVSFRTDLRYVSEAFTDFENIRESYNRGDTGPIPAYTVVDASAGYRVRHGLTATLGVKNLFDRIYIGSRLHSNPGQPQANLSSGILPGPRRQITFGLRYDF